MERQVARLALALSAGALLALPAAGQQEGSQASEAARFLSMAVPESGIRAELLQDMEVVEQKLIGLAEAMQGHYAWRPAEGVRSVSEVFAHIAGANLLFPMLVGIDPPEEFAAATPQEMFAMMGTMEEQLTAPEEIRQLIPQTFAHARGAVAGIPDERLDETVRYFGREGTVRQVLALMVTHMHEHLGQQVAYARVNGVVPPWSQGGE